MTAGCPVAFNGCNCICHRRPGVKHFMACCGPHSPIERVKRYRDSDGSGEADKTGTGLAVGDSADPKGIAQGAAMTLPTLRLRRETVTDKLSVADVLDRAAAIVEPVGAWQQFQYATDADSNGVNANHPSACRFCAMGAIYCAAGDVPEIVSQTRGFLSDAFGRSMGSWNDDPGRTQSEVVSRLREAANLARERGL